MSICHASLDPAGVSTGSLSLEAIAFAWLRIGRHLQNVAALLPACSTAASQAWDRLSHVAQQMDVALGLDGGPPPKPLLWKHGGHPQLPVSEQLCQLAARLDTLCDVTRWEMYFNHG